MSLQDLTNDCAHQSTVDNSQWLARVRPAAEKLKLTAGVVRKRPDGKAITADGTLSLLNVSANMTTHTSNDSVINNPAAESTRRRLLSKIALAVPAALLVTAQPAQASDLAVYPQTTDEANAGVTPVHLNYQPGSVRRYGADATGITDSSLAFKQAISCNRTIDASNGSWVIGQSISIPSYRSIDLRGAVLTAALNSSTPLFTFNGTGSAASENLHIQGAGGVLMGTASAVLQCTGVTNQPTAIGQYARFIRLEGLTVTSTTIGLFLDLQKAVNTIFITECSIFAGNGINANGKCVAVMVDKSILYGSTDASEFGVRLRNPGGSSFYSEGWQFSDSTIDGFATSFDVTDIFVLSVTGSYVGSLPNGYAFDFRAPTTTHCCNISIGAGCIFASRIRFQGDTSYYAKVAGFESILTTGAAIEILENASHITISNAKFASSSGTGVQTSGSANTQIICENLEFDFTFTNGVIFNHTAGGNCVIQNISGPVSGALLWGAPVTTRMTNFAVANATVASLKMTYNAADFPGSYAVASVISTVAFSGTAGETGVIDFSLFCSGMNAATQRFDIAVPAGMVVPAGSHWSAQFIYPSAASGIVAARIPYYCTSNISGGALSIANGAGNTVSIQSHSRFGFIRD